MLNDGRANPHPSAGSSYVLISRDEILSLIANPPSLPKEQGQWIIPSTYNGPDARSHAAQRANGSYPWLAADIDKGSPALETVMQAVRAVLGPDAYFVVYSSRSAKPEALKWRVLVPLARELSGAEYSGYQASFFDALEHCGLEMDRTLERTGQLVYLPNRGDLYQWQADGSSLFDAKGHAGMSARASEYSSIAQAVASSGQARNEGARSHLAAFRRKHSIAELLALYGYVNKPQTDHWQSPYSSGFSTQDRGDHWISLSYTDAEKGLGKSTPNGSRYGDAFDLYVHFNCGGDREAAEQYARSILKEDDAYFIGHGREVWAGLLSIGSGLGPAGHRIELELAAQRVEALKTEDPTIQGAEHEHDWNIDWPPGIAGEIAKAIYRASSRPVKQFAIAMSLYILAGMAGQKYNVEGFGLNLYMALVGGSGTGKGEARRGAKRIYGSFGLEAQDPQGVAAVYDHDWPVSASGLRKMFDESGSTRAIFKEDADAIIESLTNAMPGSNGDLLRAALSSFYDQSGKGLNLGAVRASKLEDSSAMVSSPSLTIGFDLQVDPFKRYLGHNVVLQTGIGARFLYIIRYGKRMHSQKHRETEIPAAMIDYLKTIWNGIRMQVNTVTDVAWDPEAHKAFEDMDDQITDRIRDGRPEEDLLNRAHINTARVAANLAVGINQVRPVITMEIFEWARGFVIKGYDECLKLMAAGEVGSGERVRVAQCVKAIKDYVKMPSGRRHGTYRVPKGLDTLDEVLCEKYFLNKLGNSNDFRGTDNGATTEDLIRRTLAELVRQEYLIEANREMVMTRHGIVLHQNLRQPLYLLGPAFV